MMKLSTPSVSVFLISTAMVLIVLLVQYFKIEVPVLGLIARSHPFEVTLVAWAILFAGIAFKI